MEVPNPATWKGEPFSLLKCRLPGEQTRKEYFGLGVWKKVDVCVCCLDLGVHGYLEFEAWDWEFFF
jgi:hypothetical protein